MLLSWNYPFKLLTKAVEEADPGASLEPPGERGCLYQGWLRWTYRWGQVSKASNAVGGWTVICFVSDSAKFGICISDVVLNGSIVEVKIRTFKSPKVRILASQQAYLLDPRRYKCQILSLIETKWITVYDYSRFLELLFFCTFGVFGEYSSAWRTLLICSWHPLRCGKDY